MREQLVTTAMDGLELPPEDYPFYVLIDERVGGLRGALGELREAIESELDPA